jgi:hypothetical protein
MEEYTNIEKIIELINSSLTDTLRNCLAPLVNKIKHSDECYGVLLDVLKKIPEYQNLVKENEELKQKLNEMSARDDIVHLKINEKNNNNKMNTKKIIHLNDNLGENILIKQKSLEHINCDFIMNCGIGNNITSIIQKHPNEIVSVQETINSARNTYVEDQNIINKLLSVKQDEEEDDEDTEEEAEEEEEDDEDTEEEAEEEEEAEDEAEDEEEAEEAEDEEEAEEEAEDEEEAEEEAEDEAEDEEAEEEAEQEAEEEAEDEDVPNYIPTKERTIPNELEQHIENSIPLTSSVNNTEECQEEEEEELYVVELEIDGKDFKYYTNDDENGDIYEILDDEGIGNKVGVFKEGDPEFFE